jgi:hypothetical protein
MNYKELLNGVILKEVLGNPNSLINIDINDIKDLFLQGGNISEFEIIVDAIEENRMKLLVNKIKEHTKYCHALSRALVFFFSHPTPAVCKLKNIITTSMVWCHCLNLC